MRQCSIWTTLFFIFGAFLTGSALSLQVLAPEDLSNTTFKAPRLIWFGDADWSFDIVADLASINDSDVEQKIVLMKLEDQNYTNIADLVNRKVAGVAVSTGHSPLDIPGLYNYVRGRQSYFDLNLPTVIVSSVAFEKLRIWIEDEGRNLTMLFLSHNFEVSFEIDRSHLDVNPWDATMLSGVMIFYSVFMSAFTLTCVILATYKLIMFVRVKGCEQSIPHTILIIEIVANGIRFFACAVDPLQSRAILPYIVSQMFFTTSWPFVIINLLLVSFYWHELMTKTSMKINKFLSRLRIPFWVIFGVILGLELAASFLRAIGYNLNAFRTVMGVGYIIIGFACCGFYIYTGKKLTDAMRKASKELMSSNRVKRLNRTSNFIYALTAGVIVWLVAIAIGGLTNTFWIPWGYFGVWVGCFLSTTFISLMQILAIHEPKALCGHYGTSTDMSRTKSTGDRSGTASFNMSAPQITTYSSGV